MTINVLHIDDDDAMGVLVKKSLESSQSGINVTSVTSSLQALKLLLNPHGFQCVLSDYQMPEMDGMRLLSELRSRGDDLPFLFLTGQGNEDIARKAFKAGAHDYFTKEMDFAHYDRIANSIEQAVRTYQSERSKADAEKKLRESQERYRMLFEKMLNAFALHEVVLGSDGRPVDYVFVEANPAFEKMTGLSADDIIGKQVRDVLPGIEQFWIDTYAKVALTGEAAYFEHYSDFLGKHLEVMAFSPQERTFATIFHDISDHKDNRGLQTL